MSIFDPAGSRWAHEICEAFGLKNVISFDFHMAVDDVAKITITTWADKDNVEKFAKVLKRYKITGLEEINALDHD